MSSAVKREESIVWRRGCGAGLRDPGCVSGFGLSALNDIGQVASVQYFLHLQKADDNDYVPYRDKVTFHQFAKSAAVLGWLTREQRGKGTRGQPWGEQDAASHRGIRHRLCKPTFVFLLPANSMQQKIQIFIVSYATAFLS